MPNEWAAAPADLTPLTSANATLAVLQHVLRGIGEDDLSRSTPCTEFTVGQLEAHLLGSLTSLAGLARDRVIVATTIAFMAFNLAEGMLMVTGPCGSGLAR